MNMSPLHLNIGLDCEALRRTVQNVHSMTQRDGHSVQMVNLYYHLEGKNHGLCQDITSSKHFCVLHLRPNWRIYWRLQKSDEYIPR